MARDLKYANVKRILRDHIRGRYPVGSKLPSTAALHKEIGVSPGTVNRAIRDLVDEGLVERIERRGTFVADNARPATTDIGFLWPGEVNLWRKDAYRAAVLHSVEDEAQSKDAHVLVGSTRRQSHPPFTGKDRHKVAGVLLLFNHEPAVVTAYHEEGLPVVLVDPFVRMAGVPFVTSDHYSAAREATLHLIELGHRRILHPTLDFPISAIPVKERILGYQEAMKEAGLEKYVCIHKLPMVMEAESESEEEVARREARAEKQLFAALEEQRATACCCFNDITASRVMQMCHRRNLRVPDDLSIVGTNDDNLASNTVPPLTTVHLPMEELGRAAVQMLRQLIATKQLTGKGETLPVHLVCRASTKPLTRRTNSRKR